jgi:hypothetical protein
MNITKERKYILIAGAVLLFLGLIYRFYPDLYDFFSVQEDIAIKQNQVEKYQSVIAGRKDLEKRKNILEKRLKSLEASLLSGRTASLAAVELQEKIKEAGRSAGGINIDSMRVMSTKKPEDSDYTRVPVRFTVTTDIRQLKELLYQLEAGPKLLIVQELRMDSQALRTPGQIRVTMTIEGIMQG